MQMTESWLRMMEGDERVAGDLSGRIGRFLSSHSQVEEPSASKIRHNSQKNGDSGREALATVIEEASRAYGVDADLIRSVIDVESGFRPDSLSPKGAMGLMQLMPDTARELGVEDPYDPRQNIMGGTRYLRQLIDRYGGDVRTALTAYNWGMGNVARHPEKIPDETVAYVERVSHRYRELKA
jgi:soluble lytic murein transglycosylase-like protein